MSFNLSSAVLNDFPFEIFLTYISYVSCVAMPSSLFCCSHIILKYSRITDSDFRLFNTSTSICSLSIQWPMSQWSILWKCQRYNASEPILQVIRSLCQMMHLKSDFFATKLQGYRSLIRYSSHGLRVLLWKLTEVPQVSPDVCMNCSCPWTSTHAQAL